MARRGRVNPLEFGLMGAVIGGLSFKLNEHLENIRLQADMAKEQRLEALYREREARENAEWTRRTEIDAENRRVEGQIDFMRQARLQQGNFEFRAAEGDKDRQHDVRMEGLRTGNAMDVQEFASNLRTEEAGIDATLRRQNHAWERAYNAEFDRQTGGGSAGAGKGIVGSDGRTYRYGEALPAGVKAVGGYGVSWAPSESKSRSERTHRGQTTPATAPRAAPAASAPAQAPAGYVLIGYSNGKPVYRGPDGQNYIDE